ncbi:MAG TPA: thiamine ABC transporter substrate-binding protein [Thermoplasmata archaeon]|nr:thiamine ABC transporter substrate-binding protein [Thermoplasmata archaeon]
MVAIAIALLVAVTGFGLVEYASQLGPAGEPTLVVYTYPSLFGGINCGAPAFATVFGAFEATHHVRIEVECPAGTLLETLLAQAGAPGADLVIGLDELTTPVAEADHLLVPYRPPALADVPAPLVSELSADDAAVPYEYGYLAIDYNASFAASTQGAVAHATFSDFTANASWARGLLTEDPEYDITGEEFLAWQIEFYEAVLHQNWTSFWRSVWAEGLPAPAPSWGAAFGEFSAPSGNPPMVVSYSTDPAYAAASGESGEFNSTVSWWNGTAYGWRTIYGIGIVNGSRQIALDESFENWFLGGAVQSEIPENEWEYPANATIPLPAVFDAAIDPATIDPLNADVSSAELAADLPGWIATWLGLAPGTG